MGFHFTCLFLLHSLTHGSQSTITFKSPSFLSSKALPAIKCILISVCICICICKCICIWSPIQISPCNITAFITFYCYKCLEVYIKYLRSRFTLASRQGPLYAFIFQLVRIIIKLLEQKKKRKHVTVAQCPNGILIEFSSTNYFSSDIFPNTYKDANLLRIILTS